jgi:MFS family permease
MTDASSKPDKRTLWSAYAIGLFGMGYIDVFGFLIPLYAISLGMSATEVGALVGFRTVLTLLFSIHVGTLMDRFGTLRVMKICTLVAMLLAPVYPLTENFWGLLTLQMLVGGAVSFGWAGGQTLIAQITHGDAEYIGRFSFASRIGTCAAPLVAGLLWDIGGVWPGYLLCLGWGVFLFLTLVLAPVTDEVRGTETGTAREFTVRSIMPRLEDYVKSFAMMAAPIVAISMAVMFLRNSTSGVQNAVYVVYMEEIGLTGFMIGVLFAVIEGATGLGSLLGGRAMRLGDPRWTLVHGTSLSILAIVVTPVFVWVSPTMGIVVTLLIAAQFARGILQGLTQPIMFSVQSHAVSAAEQGSMVGLRQTINRAAALLVPPIMGLFADLWGTAQSFLILGAILLALCGVLMMWVYRSPPEPVGE